MGNGVRKEEWNVIRETEETRENREKKLSITDISSGNLLLVFGRP